MVMPFHKMTPECDIQGKWFPVDWIGVVMSSEHMLGIPLTGSRARSRFSIVIGCWDALWCWQCVSHTLFNIVRKKNGKNSMYFE